MKNYKTHVVSVLLICSVSVMLSACGVVPDGVKNAFGSSATAAKSALAPKALSVIDQQSLNVKTNWSVQSDLTTGFRFSAKPISDATALYVAGGRSVAAYDKSTGARLWQHYIGESISAGVSINNNQVIVGTKNGYVIALSISTGKPVWTAQLESKTLSLSAENVNIIVFERWMVNCMLWPL